RRLLRSCDGERCRQGQAHAALEPADALSRRSRPRRGFLEDRGLERAYFPVAGLPRIPDRRGTERIPLAPFLLLLSPALLLGPEIALELLSSVNLGLVTVLPFAPSASRQEDADQDAQQEDEGADHPQVRVRRNRHFASPTSMESRPLRTGRWPRSQSAGYQRLMKLSWIEQVAGPKITTNRVGKMNRISGIVMIAGRRAAFSSARIIRA